MVSSRFMLIVALVSMCLIVMAVQAEEQSCKEHKLDSAGCDECCFNLGKKPSPFIKRDRLCRCGIMPETDGVNRKCSHISIDQGMQFKEFKRRCTNCCHENGKQTPFIFIGTWCKCSKKDYKKKE